MKLLPKILPVTLFATCLVSCGPTKFSGTQTSRPTPTPTPSPTPETVKFSSQKSLNTYAPPEVDPTVLPVPSTGPVVVVYPTQSGTVIYQQPPTATPGPTKYSVTRDPYNCSDTVGNSGGIEVGDVCRDTPVPVYRWTKDGMSLLSMRADKVCEQDTSKCGLSKLFLKENGFKLESMAFMAFKNSDSLRAHLGGKILYVCYHKLGFGNAAPAEYSFTKFEIQHNCIDTEEILVIPNELREKFKENITEVVKTSDGAGFATYMAAPGQTGSAFLARPPRSLQP